ncbi:hypothetical protein TSTA_059490 [Talaromyces stipitatus ATCC 10500]|uniref:Uncharacterized protein n=1 Tax=Talaromyces stipitatus (strain ATCC 10500 / CBS 375.48 / QM 6759 / NRRL 1006) TaxID=441959 RepID=B8MQN9_TALSN|nr:uncharacterized protein TSTA_059490 [Talaromyces stipitatus ATCC 10500]EED13462.1 hypothetical protein TSTA_059490 [Talaromyces stipitatus ATCC 10500]
MAARHHLEQAELEVQGSTFWSLEAAQAMLRFHHWAPFLLSPVLSKAAMKSGVELTETIRNALRNGGQGGKNFADLPQ